RNDLEAVRQAHLGDLAQRRVRLLRRRRVAARADAAALRAALQRRRLRLDGLGLAAVADELVDRGHKNSRWGRGPGRTKAAWGGRDSGTPRARPSARGEESLRLYVDRAPLARPPLPTQGRARMIDEGRQSPMPMRCARCR